MYQQINPMYEGAEVKFVRRLHDNATIPFEPDNIDYQEYLKWVAEGNEPLPADE